MKVAALALLGPLVLLTTAWQPAPLRATTATLKDVLAAHTQAVGTADPGFAQRREAWVYRNGAREIRVALEVAGDDYRASVHRGAARSLGGRFGGVVWRADANGVAHATLSDLQGDPLDRLPRSLFPIDAANCALAGETTDAKPAWIVLDRSPHDKPHWFFVDRGSGLIVREQTRVGKRTITTTFDDYARVDGTLRPRHWTVRDGDAADDLDVRVASIVPAAVDGATLAPPASARVFAPADPATRAVRLAARFESASVFVDADLAGHRARFLLDSGTPGIILDRDLAARWGFAPALGHASVPRVAVGGLVRDNVDMLTAPLRGFGEIDGILGYDFFVGNVVRIDYLRRRVEVYARDAAEIAFADPATSVLPLDAREGIPLVHAGFGDAVGDRFALDTGSPHLYVFDPFARRYAKEIAALWTPVAFADGRRNERVLYLEGAVALEARRVGVFTFGPARFTQLTVGVEQPVASPDGIAIPLDGIVGTDELSRFDLWFDDDGGRIGIRTVEITARG